MTPEEMANTWGDAVFELVADFELRIQKEMLVPHYLLDKPRKYQTERQEKALKATALLRQTHEAMIKQLLEPANVFADPAPYLAAIRSRLDAARAKAMQEEENRKQNSKAIDCISTSVT